MTEKQVRNLLKEFDYDKNTIDDTLEFLLLMCVYLTQFKGGK